MINNEEEKLHNYKKRYDNIQVSEQALNDAVMEGFHKAVAEEKRYPKKKIFVYGVAAVAVLLLSLVTSIRVSPAFADYLTNVPGMEKVIALIQRDKGMMSAVQNEYYQTLGVNQEKNGLKVTIDGAIADEKGLVLFYTLSSKEKQKEISIDGMNLVSLDGNNIDEAVSGYSPSHTTEKGQNSYSGTIDYMFEKPLDARRFRLDLKIHDQKYRIPFQLNENFQQKKTYKLNKTVLVEGQKLTFAQVDIYPLRVAVKIKMDSNNTKKILNIDDLRLVDQNGETWGESTNGPSASLVSENEQILYLQSNYFRKPKNLYLVLSKMQAIDKKDGAIVIDTQKLTILNQPPGNKLSNLRKEENELVLMMQATKDYHFSFMGKIKDANGKELHSSSESSSGPDENGKIRVGFDLSEMKEYKNPISISPFFYPSWIEGKVKVKIK